MPSAALLEWNRTRAERLDELFDIHATIGGSGRGRRWRTQQINWSITLRLSGEFQGFARDLHTLASDQFASWACVGNAAATSVTAAALTRNRQLDRGNAQPSALGSDFGRLGLSFWTALSTRDQRTVVRQAHLERLNEARNAIAHSRQDELLKLEAAGYPITLPTLRRWRRTLGALATTMDLVLADHLATLFARGRPW
jgi:hypothetical protein